MFKNSLKLTTKMTIGWLLLSSSVLLMSCGPQASTDSTVEAKVSADSGAVSKSANIIKNASFDSWSKTMQPMGWRAYNGSVEQPSKGTVRLAPPQSLKAVTLEQNVKVNTQLANRVVKLTAHAMASEANKFSVVLRYVQAGQKKIVTRTHSGNGSWENLRMSVPLPADVDDAAGLQVIFTLAPDARLAADIDAVAATVEE